jgi:hypothetical protein
MDHKGGNGANLPMLLLAMLFCALVGAALLFAARWLGVPVD